VDLAPHEGESRRARGREAALGAAPPCRHVGRCSRCPRALAAVRDHPMTVRSSLCVHAVPAAAQLRPSVRTRRRHADNACDPVHALLAGRRRHAWHPSRQRVREEMATWMPGAWGRKLEWCVLGCVTRARTPPYPRARPNSTASGTAGSLPCGRRSWERPLPLHTASHAPAVPPYPACVHVLCCECALPLCVAQRTHKLHLQLCPSWRLDPRGTLLHP
jgi:hypothetical protein